VQVKVLLIGEETPMSSKKPEQPKRIAKKVTEIRLSLDLTQEQMAVALRERAAKGVRIHDGYIGLYELGKRTPLPLVILAYAKVAGISTDILIDDELVLPKKLSGKLKH
jgi:transcriptional regulator with XRE-family HTH domain